MDNLHATLLTYNLEPKLQELFMNQAAKNLGNEDLIKNYRMSFSTF